MNETPKNLSSKSGLKIEKRMVAYFIGALLIFLLGFFIFYGKEAASTGSWKYLITHSDEYGYWAFARGTTETPISDGHPFYYEERGRTHTIPFTASLLVGMLSKLFHVPVLCFFPIWHIGMPFLLWGTLFLCFTKIWSQPPPASAAASMLLLLSTLFLSGHPHFILFRFSRPGDGLWLLMLWVSIVMNLKPEKKIQTFWLCIIAFISFWLHPYYVLLGALITGLEALWQGFKKRNIRYASQLGIVLISVLIAGSTYYAYMKINMIHNPWFFITNDPGASSQTIVWPPIILYALIIFMILTALKYSNTGFTKLDRLLLFIFLIEPITTHIQIITTWNFQFGSHRYYFLMIELACLLGWITEKLPGMLRNEKLRKWTKYFGIALGLAGIILLANPHTNFFRYLPRSVSHYNHLDNAFTIFGMILMLFFSVWCSLLLRKRTSHSFQRNFTLALILFLAIAGYGFRPSQTRSSNLNVPFDGAYQWLDHHAQANEVVLTVPPSRRWMNDYLILHTKQKTFFNAYYGNILPSKEGDHQYRIQLYTTLLLGWLDTYPVGGHKKLEDKLHHLRLDYILTDLPSPFLERIQRQLKGWIEEVYRDERCLLWRVGKRGETAR